MMRTHLFTKSNVDPQNLSDLINLLLVMALRVLQKLRPETYPKILNYPKHSAPLKMTIMGRPSLCDATDKSTDRVSIGHVLFIIRP